MELAFSFNVTLTLSLKVYADKLAVAVSKTYFLTYHDVRLWIVPFLEAGHGAMLISQFDTMTMGAD